jgi:GcrA cell cycle regulator
MSLKSEPEPLLDFMLGPQPIDGLRIVDLSPAACRWPSGDPQNLHEFRYCGASASRSVYCERHAKLSKTPKAEAPGNEVSSREERLKWPARLTRQFL